MQFYSDGSCGSTTGAAAPVGDGVTTTAFTSTAYGSSYSFNITTILVDGTADVSGCSSAIRIEFSPTVGGEWINVSANVGGFSLDSFYVMKYEARAQTGLVTDADGIATYQQVNQLIHLGEK